MKLTILKLRQDLMFTLEQITCFCAVYKNGSYSAAARAMGRDRSTVREHVNSLEDNIGLPLFEIQGKSAIPTPTAESLYPRARIITRHAQEFTQSALAAFDQAITQLNIYHDVLLPSTLVVEIERLAGKHFPHLQLNWLHRNRDETLSDMVDGNCQLAIMPNLNQVMPEKQIWFRNLGLLPVSAYVRADSPLLRQPRITMKELQLEKQFLSENHLQAGIANMKVSPNLHIISNNDILLELVKREGWTILSQAFAAPYVARGELVEIKVVEVVNTLKYGLALYFPAGAEENDVLALFIRWVTDYAAEYLE